MPSARRFFSREDEEIIISAIREAELNSSGEIRVHLENRCKIDPVDRAGQLFVALNMAATERRNGVLIYIAALDHRFAIVGDEAIDEKVPADFWESIRDQMRQDFRDGAYVKGVAYAVKSAGDQLKQHFPAQPRDINELPDDISYSE